MRIPISIYPRHIYLSQKDAGILFWKGFELTKKKKLPQPGYFTAEEQLTIKGPQWVIENVTVFWPWKKQSQVELYDSDNAILGIQAPKRIPWDLQNSASITLIGPIGKVDLQQGAIISQKHLTITVSEAQEFWLTSWQDIKISIGNPKNNIFLDNIIVNIRDNYTLDCIITAEEWNTFWIQPWAWWEIIL